jgi:hypothetical protein
MCKHRLLGWLVFFMVLQGCGFGLGSAHACALKRYGERLLWCWKSIRMGNAGAFCVRASGRVEHDVLFVLTNRANQ